MDWLHVFLLVCILTLMCLLTLWVSNAQRWRTLYFNMKEISLGYEKLYHQSQETVSQHDRFFKAVTESDILDWANSAVKEQKHEQEKAREETTQAGA